MKSSQLLLTMLFVGSTAYAQNSALIPGEDEAGAIPYPDGDAQVTEHLSRALISSNTGRKETLLKSTSSWDGGAIAYPDGVAEVTAIRLIIQEGEKPKFHCHPIPTFGYLAEGRVQVETRNGDIKTIEEGEVLTEVMNTVHRGISLDGRAELIVFYAGAEGLETTLLEENPGDQPCKP